MYRLTIAQLEYVIAVDTHRNFAKAAAHCHITQPALSMQVRKLEEQLGVLIFDRSKKPVVPTKLGEKIIDQARSSISSLGRIQELVSVGKGSVSGVLRIGIIPTLAPYLLPRFLASFSKKYPSIKLTLEEVLSDQIIEKLTKDQLDVGIMVAPSNKHKIEAEPLFREEFYIYSASEHRLQAMREVRLSKLDTSDMWILKEGHCFRDQVESLCGGQISNEHKAIKFESGSLETLKNMVDRQLGFTLLPELATQYWNPGQKKKLKRFSGRKPVREISLVMHRVFLKQSMIGLLKKEILSSLPAKIKNQRSTKIVPWTAPK